MEVGFPHYIYLYSFILIYHLYPKSGDSFCDIFYGDVLTHRSVTNVSYFTPKATHMFSDRKHLLPNKYWLVVWNIFYFSIHWECHPPNWRTPSFFRGIGQPPTRISGSCWYSASEYRQLPLICLGEMVKATDRCLGPPVWSLQWSPSLCRWSRKDEEQLKPGVLSGTTKEFSDEFFLGRLF